MIEVVLAVGVCAGAVVAILALLPMLARDAVDAADLRAAQQMSGSLGVELRRIAMARGLDALAGMVPVLSAPPGEGVSLVAARDGMSVRIESDVTGESQSDEQHFLIEVYRYSQPPLAYAPGGDVLPLYVRVSWPFRAQGTGTVTSRHERRSCGFTLSIHR